MNCKLFPLYVFLIFSFSALCQPNFSTKYFQRLFGGEEGIAAEAVSIVKIKENYYVFGNYDSKLDYKLSNANTDFFLMKIDKNGEIINLKRIGSDQREIARKMIEYDGKLLVSGMTLDGQRYRRNFLDNMVVIEFDTFLNKTNELFLGDIDDDGGVISLCKSNDNFLISYNIGNTQLSQSNQSFNEMILTLVDSKMKPKWSYYYNNPTISISSVFTSNDNYLCFGIAATVNSVNSNSVKANSICILSLNKEGKVLSQNSLNLTVGSITEVPKVVDLQNGTYILLSEIIKNNQSDLLVIKINKAGNILWSKLIGGNADEKAKDIIIDPYENDGVVIIGSTSSFANDKKDDGFFLTLDKNGTVKKSVKFGRQNNDVFNSITSDYPYGFAVCGTSFSNNRTYNGDSVSEVWFLRMDKDGCSSPDRSELFCSSAVSFNSTNITLNTSELNINRGNWLIQSVQSFSPYPFSMSSDYEICSFSTIPLPPRISPPMLDELNGRPITYKYEFSTSSSMLKAKLWDNSREDGDIVSLYLDKKVIVDKKALKREPFEFTIDITNNNTNLVYFAENLGAIVPNTGAISIDDGVQVQTFVLNSDMGKSEAISIKSVETPNKNLILGSLTINKGDTLLLFKVSNNGNKVINIKEMRFYQYKPDLPNGIKLSGAILPILDKTEIKPSEDIIYKIKIDPRYPIGMCYSCLGNKTYPYYIQIWTDESGNSKREDSKPDYKIPLIGNFKN